MLGKENEKRVKEIVEWISRDEKMRRGGQARQWEDDIRLAGEDIWRRKAKQKKNGELKRRLMPKKKTFVWTTKCVIKKKRDFVVFCEDQVV